MCLLLSVKTDIHNSASEEAELVLCIDVDAFLHPLALEYLFGRIMRVFIGYSTPTCSMQGPNDPDCVSTHAQDRV